MVGSVCVKNLGLGFGAVLRIASMTSMRLWVGQAALLALMDFATVPWEVELELEMNPLDLHSPVRV